MSIIVFDNVSKSYKSDFSFRSKTPAIKDVSFTIRRGEVFSIIGPNGAGKSSLLKVLMGFIHPDTGSITINGEPVSKPKSRGNIGFLPENPCLFEHLTIQDHLVFVCRIANISRADAQKKITYVLKQVGLDAVSKMQIKKFSKGMTQRAALANALLLEPELLVLDEPMSGLDPLGRQLVTDIIRDINERGTTILLCSHILTDVERICDRIGIMHRGHLISITTPKEIRMHYDDLEISDGKTPLERFFLDKLKAFDT